MNEETPDTSTDAAPVDLAGKMHFHMVLADVIFETKRVGITSHRTQFMTQSPVNEFTAARIHQLQNSAAATVREKLTAKQADGFKVHDALFLAITPCGYMSNAEFYGAGMTASVNVDEADASPGVDVNPPVADPATNSTDNVLPFPAN
jgi:hypothetical protein